MSDELLSLIGERLRGTTREVMLRVGELPPLGAFMGTDGSVQISAMQPEPGQDFRDCLPRLKQWLRDQAETLEWEAVGFACEVFLHSPDGGKQDAIQIALEHAGGRAVNEFIIFEKKGKGKFVWQDPMRGSREREIFGFPGFSLTLEGQPIEQSPTLLQLKAAVRQLTPNGGPGFLIVEGPDSHYVQSAGGAGRLIAEWRQYPEPGRFTHWIAGLPGRPSRRRVKVPTNGAYVTARENEVLGVRDVEKIVESFVRELPPPAEYSWRDMTEES